MYEDHITWWQHGRWLTWQHRNVYSLCTGLCQLITCRNKYNLNEESFVCLMLLLSAAVHFSFFYHSDSTFRSSRSLDGRMCTCFQDLTWQNLGPKPETWGRGLALFCPGPADSSAGLMQRIGKTASLPRPTGHSTWNTWHTWKQIIREKRETEIS